MTNNETKRRDIPSIHDVPEAALKEVSREYRDGIMWEECIDLAARRYGLSYGLLQDAYRARWRRR